MSPHNHITYARMNSLKESTIANIKLYSDRAQITRIFKTRVVKGKNILTIFSLPNPLDHDSLRVEARGPCIIQGVTSSKREMDDDVATSELLERLEQQKTDTANALARSHKALKAIDAYMDKLDAQNLDISKLGEAMDIYDTTGQKWDNNITSIEKEKKEVEDSIDAEYARLQELVTDKKLRVEVMVSLLADLDAEVEITLIYAVSGARWKPSYDIRVSSQDAAASRVRLTYKADISQNTGESWTDAPIKLETAQPTFGVEVPNLAIWNIRHVTTTLPGGEQGAGTARRHRRVIYEDDRDYEVHETAEITSKGHVNATFRIPGTTTIPSDDEPHQVTVAQIDLDATMSWICVPKGDTRVHLNATIKNTSDYTFLWGESNVFVDQSFIARGVVPGVSLHETFDCALGLDPSIRVTYHPPTKMYQESGFYSKSHKHSFSQVVSVHNTKNIDITGVKIQEHIPISQDANLTVKLLKPSLAAVTSASSVAGPGLVDKPRVQVSEDVYAQWAGSDSANQDLASLGKDGRLEWVCAIPAHGNVNLLLEWEVIATQKTAIVGLF